MTWGNGLGLPSMQQLERREGYNVTTKSKTDLSVMAGTGAECGSGGGERLKPAKGKAHIEPRAVSSENTVPWEKGKQNYGKKRETWNKRKFFSTRRALHQMASAKTAVSRVGKRGVCAKRNGGVPELERRACRGKKRRVMKKVRTKPITYRKHSTCSRRKIRHEGGASLKLGVE